MRNTRRIVSIAVVALLLIGAGVGAFLVLNHRASQRAQQAENAANAKKKGFTVEKPAAIDLSSPEKAARSYADWVAWGLASGDVSVAQSTMTGQAARLAELQGKADEQFKSRTLKKLVSSRVVSLDERTPGKAKLITDETWLSARIPASTTGMTSRDAGTQTTSRIIYSLKKDASGWVVESATAIPQKN
ncbi:MAG: hypothetical protein FWC54_04055 [Actinomycetia bacterium]|nr:hypothetical protein [Actinomycetes bacterium]